MPHGTQAMSFFSVFGIQAVCDILFGSLSTTDILKHVEGIEHMSAVKILQLNALKNHVIPLKYNMRHSSVYTDMRLELGPVVTNTGNVVRCFTECPSVVDPGNDFVTYNRSMMSMGAVMFDVAMHSIYKLNASQHAVLKRIGKMAREHVELKKQLIVQAELILAQGKQLLAQGEQLLVQGAQIAAIQRTMSPKSTIIC